jgi:class 3 adenylate cyclase
MDTIKTEEITFKPQVSIGINTGEMVSGNIGSASLKRLDYTVIGDVVNLAQRLQGTANPNQIIITEDVYQKTKESFQSKKVGEVNLKNKAKPVIIYEVIE